MFYKQIFWFVILINLLSLMLFTFNYNQLHSYFINNKSLNKKHCDSKTEQLNTDSIAENVSKKLITGNSIKLESDSSNSLTKGYEKTTVNSGRDRGYTEGNDGNVEEDNGKENEGNESENVKRNVDEKQYENITEKTNEITEGGTVGRKNDRGDIKNGENGKNISQSEDGGSKGKDDRKTDAKNNGNVKEPPRENKNGKNIGNVKEQPKENKNGKNYEDIKRKKDDKREDGNNSISGTNSSVPTNVTQEKNSSGDKLPGNSTNIPEKNDTNPPNHVTEKGGNNPKKKVTEIGKNVMEKSKKNNVKDESLPKHKTVSYDDKYYYKYIVEEKQTVKINVPEPDYKNGTIDCPENPPNLIGPINVSTTPIPKIENLEKKFNWLQSGGRYTPPCIQKQNLAIIIPFRNRTNQLLLFLQHMHPFLKKQQLRYTLIVTEQENDTLPFNKGQIMNTAYNEALKLDNFTCFIYNDVDLLPEDDRIIYKCTRTARHLTAGIDKWGYTLMYSDLFGGVVAVAKNIFKIVNGYSNRFWGWGGEDDDFRNRMDAHRVNITRYGKFARYKMIKHRKEKQNPNRHYLLKENAKYYDVDGLNDLNTTVLKLDKYLLYTRILVRVSGSGK